MNLFDKIRLFLGIIPSLDGLLEMSDREVEKYASFLMITGINDNRIVHRLVNRCIGKSRDQFTAQEFADLVFIANHAYKFPLKMREANQLVKYLRKF